ncbi:MAG: hypothetical protein M4579_002498 [Chaenotheca gracillima]|nr:MAG: hypothetical protein M4579_002498 [Chaenotheca gracillima]
MFAPKQYLYSPSPKSSGPSESQREPSKPSRGQRETSQPRQPRQATQPPVTPPRSEPSQPVSIPSRSRPIRNGQTSTSRPQYSRTARTSPENHKSDSVPPSVAALLAVTSIPPHSSPGSNQRRFRGNASPRSHTLRRSPSAKAPRIPDVMSPRSVMDVLLSPPDETEEQETDDGDEKSGGDEETSSRSISFDSMPSLDTDDESFMSPTTPSTLSGFSVRRGSCERKSKSFASPPSEDCAGDHPLLPSARIPEIPAPLFEIDDEESTSPPSESRRSLAPPKSSLLKSNLTASFRVLRSAARSFSNFTSATTSSPAFITPEDYLTRSILSISPQFTDERRPLPLPGDPTPALRRYLNPTTTPSPLDSPHAMQQYTPTHRETEEFSSFTASIQLQTYRRVPIRRSSQSSGNSSTPSVSLPSSPSPPSEPVPWPTRRENRENSDFLRVIVCEMNMRRAGKLADEAPGKARFLLPPRKPSWSTSATAEDAGGESEQRRGRTASPPSQTDDPESLNSVPTRWRSVSPG